jgi:uncharacterized protein
MKNILIVGGSGYVGKALTKKLQAIGYNVSLLTRKINKSINTPQYLWDWKQNNIDLDSINKTEVLVNLAGANVNGQRWNKKWKKEIYDSRVKATDFLFKIISQHPNKIKTFVSASATGYYGDVTSENIFHETDFPGKDFLAITCNDWEQAATKFSNLGIRTSIIRTGIIFSENSEAYRKISLPIRFGFGAAIGNGRQYFPWIHLDDLCGIYLKAISDNSMQGIFNSVAPQFITNAQVTKALANHFKNHIWLPNIPPIVIRILFGEIADSLLNGSRISSEKIIKFGFRFKYSRIDDLNY